jgi:hypothetical protein
MTSFSVKGQELDIPANVKLQFKKKNILFAFDSVEVERTTSFSIPKTARNMQIFGFSHDYLLHGEDMRVKLDAVLTVGFIVKFGLLHITKYNAKTESFECVFLTGSYYTLKQIKDAGKIKDIYFPYVNARKEIGIWAGDEDALAEWKAVDYNQNYPTLDRFPSYNLKKIVEGCFNSLGVSYSIDDYAKYFRVVPRTLKRGTIISVKSVPTIGTKKNKLTFGDSFGTIGLSGYSIPCNNMKCEVSSLAGVNFWHFLENQLAFNIDGFMFEHDVKITFPANFPDGFALVQFIKGNLADQTESMLNECFFGDFSYAFDGYTGEWYNYTPDVVSLGGLTVEIPANTPVGFLKVDGGDYVTQDPREYSTGDQSIAFNMPSWDNGMEGFSGNFTVEYADESLFSLWDNLEDRNLVDILKDLAILTGNILNVEDEVVRIDRNYFEILAKSPDIELNDVLEVNSVERTFSNYAQKNIINFVGDDVAELERVTRVYAIENVNITSDKILQTIGYTEGGLYPTKDFYGENVAIYPNTLENESASQNMIGRTRDIDLPAIDAEMLRVNIPENALITRLVENSTSIILTVRMKMLEFENLKSDTVFLYGGARWVWVDAQYSNDTMKLTLSKI